MLGMRRLAGGVAARILEQLADDCALLTSSGISGYGLLVRRPRPGGWGGVGWGGGTWCCGGLVLDEGWGAVPTQPVNLRGVEVVLVPVTATAMLAQSCTPSH